MLLIPLSLTDDTASLPLFEFVDRLVIDSGTSGCAGNRDLAGRVDLDAADRNSGRLRGGDGAFDISLFKRSRFFAPRLVLAAGG